MSIVTGSTGRPELTEAVKHYLGTAAIRAPRSNELDDNTERLIELGDAPIAAMDEQGNDLQILSVAPPSVQPLDAVDAVPLSRRGPTGSHDRTA